MKKLSTLVLSAVLAAALLVGCGSSGDAGTSQVELDPGTVVSALEAVNEVANPRAYDDFSLENEIGLTMDNIEAYDGHVTNNAPTDCAIVLVVQAKEGKAADVAAELQAYKDANSAEGLYGFDTAAKFADARIVTVGDYVVFVVAGVDGPDYSAIDDAINSATGK